MAEVILDANVIVAWLDEGDSQHSRANGLLDRIEEEGHTVALLDVLLSEAVSVMCRRARERRHPPDLEVVLEVARRWVEENAVRFVAAESEVLYETVLGVISETRGRLNFNDALVVVLQRQGLIEEFASMDRGFLDVDGFRLIGA